MSPITKVVVECQYCAFQFETQVWTVIDVSKNPNLKDDIFHGIVNYTGCPRCRLEGYVSYPLLYKDGEMEVLCFPVSMDQRGNEAVEVLKEQEAFLVVKVLSDEKWREVVYGFSSLIEKIVDWGEPYSVLDFDLENPREEEIREGLRAEIVTEEEAHLLREADFRIIENKFFESISTYYADLTDEEDKAFHALEKLVRYIRGRYDKN